MQRFEIPDKVSVGKPQKPTLASRLQQQTACGEGCGRPGMAVDLASRASMSKTPSSLGFTPNQTTLCPPPPPPQLNYI